MSEIKNYYYYYYYIIIIYEEMVLKWLIYLYNKQMKCLGQV